jgi:hypothetical protein
MMNLSLTKREKLLLQILGGFALVLGIYFLIISPLMSLKSSIDSEYENNAMKLDQLDRIHEEYINIKQKSSLYSSQLQNSQGTLTLIEEHAKTHNILKNKVLTQEQPGNVQDKYKKITTDVKFEGIDITSALNFIYSMENCGKLIRVSYLRISQILKGKSTYDVTIKFETLTSQ